MLQKCKGVSLIEVLITMVIMSIGLLGVAGMQTLGLRNNASANVRSQATMLAYDMADRVRANPGGISAYQFTSAGGLPDPDAVVDACLDAGGCTNAQMASHDTSEWLQLIAQSLPAGIGTICDDPEPNAEDGDPSDFQCAGDGTGATRTIKIWWDEDRTGTPASYKRFSTEFRP